MVGGDAELLEHDPARRRGTEAVDADRGVRVTRPAQRDPGLDRDRRHVVGQHARAVGVVLCVEELPRGQRHDPGRNAAGGERLGRGDRDGDLGAGGDDDRGGVIGVVHDVAAAGDALDRTLGGRGEHRGVLTAEDQRDRAGAVDDDLPCRGDLVAVRGADDGQVGDQPQRHDVLDRLVRGAVLADADGVVGPHEHGLGLRDGRQADRRAHVVGEHQEGAADGQHATVQRGADQGRAHGVLADAERDLRAARLVGGEQRLALERETDVAGQIGAAGDEAGHDAVDGVEHLLGCHTRGGLLVGAEGGQRGLPTGQTAGAEGGLPLGLSTGERRMGSFVPVRTGQRPARAGLPVHVDDLGGHVERLVGEVHDGLGGRDLLGAEREPVGRGVVGVVRRGEPDVGAQHDQRRLVLVVAGLDECGLERVEVLTGLADLDDLPAVGPEPADGVVAERELGRTVDRDVVVVVDVDDAAEAEVTGQRGGLVADALGQVAVGDDAVDVVVDDVGTEAGAQRLLGDGHADAVREALAEGTGGHLDTGGVVHLGVTGCRRTPLAEGLQVVELEAVAGQVEHRVLQDRGVAGAQDEPVAVRPVGRRGVVAHDAGPQDVCERGECHRGALVPGPGGVGSVHRQPADHLDRQLIQR